MPTWMPGLGNLPRKFHVPWLSSLLGPWDVYGLMSDVGSDILAVGYSSEKAHSFQNIK